MVDVAHGIELGEGMVVRPLTADEKHDAALTAAEAADHGGGWVDQLGTVLDMLGVAERAS